MIEIKLTEQEFNSLIESNMDQYCLTCVWTGKPYKGRKPDDLEGTARIFKLQPRKEFPTQAHEPQDRNVHIAKPKSLDAERKKIRVL